MEKQRCGYHSFVTRDGGWWRWREICYLPHYATLGPQAKRKPTVYALGLQSQDLPDTLMEAPASMIPLLGRTQYLRGAVVVTLKHTFRSVGLPSFRLVVTTSVKGPVG
jgi:hypothetical protein